MTEVSAYIPAARPRHSVRELLIDGASADEKAEGVPIYMRLIHAIENGCRDGVLVAGTRLPSERGLARILKLSRTTVTSAYQELESRGLIRRHVGRGSFICAGPSVDRRTFAWVGKMLDIHTGTRRPFAAEPASNDGQLLSLANRHAGRRAFPERRVPAHLRSHPPPRS